MHGQCMLLAGVTAVAVAVPEASQVADYYPWVISGRRVPYPALELPIEAPWLEFDVVLTETKKIAK